MVNFLQENMSSLLCFGVFVIGIVFCYNEYISNK